MSDAVCNIETIKLYNCRVNSARHKKEFKDFIKKKTKTRFFAHLDISIISLISKLIMICVILASHINVFEMGVGGFTVSAAENEGTIMMIMIKLSWLLKVGKIY